MVILRLWSVVYVFCKILSRGDGATHWVVTEKGMIQSHVGSPLDLRRPYDLISLLDQEKRWNEIQTVLQDLVARKSTIEKKWSNLQGHSDGIESKVALTNSDCITNIKLMSTSDLYNIATNGSERVKVFLSNEKVKDYKVPECSKYNKIEFSLSDYEHFPCLRDGSNVSLAPESSLEKMLPVESVQLFGHQIHRELIKNSSSWVHYNLGALFWRMQGNGPKAVECSKRALYYVPNIYRDIPLHNLAGILHKGGCSQEATLLLHKALIHTEASQKPQHFLALANIYFAMGYYNISLLYYDMILEIDPNKSDIKAMKDLILCFSKLETHLNDFQENVLGYLQGILTDLHDFHSLQQHWLRLSKRLMWEHSSYDEELGNFQEEALESMFSRKSQRCVKKSSTISCDLVDSPIADFDTETLQNLFQHVESETKRINERMAKSNIFKIIDEGSGAPPSYPKFPTTMSMSGEKYFDAVGWPSEDECKKWDLPFYEKEDLKLPIYLPPENKGYDIGKILTDGIGLPNGSEHKLPWYPPVCDDANAFGEKYVQQSERHILNNEIKSNQFIKNHFTKYINNGKTDEAEIGQRIITALKKQSAPSWVLSTLASLYWRIRGNPKRALDCLDLAIKGAPKDQTDVVLISIASVVNELGLVNQALKYANLAFKLNYVEPSTNFLLALLHYEANPLMAMYYMKNVLRVDSDYYEGQAEQLLKIWSCRVKLGTYATVKKPLDKVPQEICSEKDSFKGQGMICSAIGDDCKSASIQCYQAKNLEGDTILKPAFHKLRESLQNSLISSIIGEGSGDAEPDQSQLERITDPHPIHMRILLGENHIHKGSPPEFYGNCCRFFFKNLKFTHKIVGFSEGSHTDTILHVYDKSGTYPLSAHGCKEIVEADWVYFTTMWQSIVARNIDPILNNLPKSSKKRTKPYCADVKLHKNDFISLVTNKILRHPLDTVPDRSLTEWLGIISGDHKSSIEELAGKIALALEENVTSWLLATAAALYWRVVGNGEEAIICLRLAFNHVPEELKDIPLIDLASVLQRFGFTGEALEVAYYALKNKPNSVINLFTVGNILAAMGDLEEAISFHRAALTLDSSFEPARNRLQAILCTLLFDESGTLRSIPEN